MNGLKLKSLYLVFIFIGAIIFVDAGLAKSLYRSGELLLRLNTSALKETNDRKIEILSSMNVKVKKYYDFNKIYLIQIPDDETEFHALKRLRNFSAVDIVEPNYLRSINFTPNDPFFDDQYYLQKIQAQQAWDISVGRKNILIAVTDSGIDHNHDDLRNNLWKNLNEDWSYGIPGYNGIDDDGDGYIDNYYGADFVNNSGDTMDVLGHGTHVAGIIGAIGNNSIGIAGLNFNVSMMALKIIDDDGYGSISNEIEAIEYAQKKHVRLINMSFGGYDYSEIEKSVLQESNDILFVASAGNEKNNNDNNPMYPASYELPNIISVAATDGNDNLAPFSNYGIHTVDIAAPGVNIYSTFTGNTYKPLSGTSMSAPVVTGTAALVLAGNSNLTPVQIKNRILRASDQLPGLRDKILTGGRINAYHSLVATIEGPYIYNLYPDKGPIGSQIAIYGSEFGSQPGRVIFSGEKEANIIAWTDVKIMVQVPEGVTTGPVVVITDSGTSNGYVFTLTEFPVEMQISFPHLIRSDNADPIIVISNPQKENVAVSMKFISSDCGIITQKNVVLYPLEKKIIFSGVYDEDCYSYSLTCKSNNFFGAAVISREDEFSKLIVMPHIIGGNY